MSYRKMNFFLITFCLVLYAATFAVADETDSSPAGESVLSATDANASHDPLIKQLLHANRELGKRFGQQNETLQALLKEKEEAFKQFNEMLKTLDDKRLELQKELEEKINQLQKQKDGLEEEVKKLTREHEQETRRFQISMDRLREKMLNDFDTVEFDGITFVKIPAGTFKMGTDEAALKELEQLGWWKKLYACEMPCREVTISKPFLISTCEITQGQWKRVIDRDPSLFDSDDRPVENVNWYDTFRYTDALTEKWGAKYRLPTEAEWEYCARAGGTGVFGLGKNNQPITPDTVSEYAWLTTNSENKTQPVAKKQPNAWGLFDMHGNVWEWCNDHFSCDAYQTLEAKDPRFRGDVTEAVFRGGCWDLEAQFARSAFRGGNLKDHTVSYVGFRVVRELSE